MNWTRLLHQCFRGKIVYSTAMWKVRRTPPSWLYQNIMFCPVAPRFHNSFAVLVFSIPAPAFEFSLPHLQLFSGLKFLEEVPKWWKHTNLCFLECYSYLKKKNPKPAMYLGRHARFSTSTLSTGGPLGWFPFNSVLSFLFPHAMLRRECFGIMAWDQTLALLRVASVRYFDLFAPSLSYMWRCDIARAVLTATGEVSDSMPVKG